MDDRKWFVSHLRMSSYFAESLRPVFAKPILLCSDGDFTPEMIKGHVDAVISKDPAPWSELSSRAKMLAKGG